MERALAAGMVPTHIDAHMAAAMLPSLLEVHVRLADAYGLFPVLPRTIEWAPEPAGRSWITAAERLLWRRLSSRRNGITC